MPWVWTRSRVHSPCSPWQQPPFLSAMGAQAKGSASSVLPPEMAGSSGDTVPEAAAELCGDSDTQLAPPEGRGQDKDGTLQSGPYRPGLDEERAREEEAKCPGAAGRRACPPHRNVC